MAVKGRRRGRGIVGSVFKSIVPSVVSAVPTVINRAVDALPIELHLPGYRFCGPGTKLDARLARGDRGINELDEACREHDMAYAQYTDNESRRIADRRLAAKAWERAKAWNSGISERAYATAVAAAMKAKSVVGSGQKMKVKRGGGKKKKNVTPRRSTKASGLYLRPYRKN